MRRDGKAKASVMLAFPMVWESRLLQPLLFNVVLGVLVSELDNNGIRLKISFTDGVVYLEAQEAQFSNITSNKITRLI